MDLVPSDKARGLQTPVWAEYKKIVNAAEGKEVCTCVCVCVCVCVSVCVCVWRGSEGCLWCRCQWSCWNGSSSMSEPGKPLPSWQRGEYQCVSSVCVCEVPVLQGGCAVWKHHSQERCSASRTT